MGDKYLIRFYQDNIYELIDRNNNEQVMTGTLQELNAYLDLRQKGFDL